MAGPAARASDSYKDIASFTAGKSAVVVRASLSAAGDRRGVIWIGNPPFASTLIYRPPEWPAVVRAVAEATAAAGQLSAGQTRQIAEITCAVGSRLRLEAMMTDGQPALRLTLLDHTGGKYPPVPFLLAAGEFARLQRALDDVTKELTATKLTGYY